MRFRVFAALELPSQHQAHLGDVLAGLQSAVPAGAVRWVRPAAIHLTLKFYGDVDGDEVGVVQDALAAAAGPARPLRLSMVGLGVFPHARRPQVIWAGVGGDLNGLYALQADVETRSAGLGFTPEGREYRPHLTLGRVAGGLRPADQRRLLEHLAARQGDWFGNFEAEALSLVRSDLRPTGSVYTVLYSAPLGQAQRQAPAEQ